jgi:hypothetical protein
VLLLVLSCRLPSEHVKKFLMALPWSPMRTQAKLARRRVPVFQCRKTPGLSVESPPMWRARRTLRRTTHRGGLCRRRKERRSRQRWMRRYRPKRQRLLQRVGQQQSRPPETQG